MADLKKVMKKLNSQKSEKEKLATEPKKKKKKKAVAPLPEPEEEEEDEDLDEEEEDDDEEEDDSETEESEEEESETDEAKEAQIIADATEKLNNNGAFRYEMLHQLQEIGNELRLLNYQLSKALGGTDGRKQK